MTAANNHYELILIGCDFVFTPELRQLLQQFTSVIWIVDTDDALPSHPTHLRLLIGNPHFLSERLLQIDTPTGSHTCAFDFAILAPGTHAFRPHWWIEHPLVSLGGAENVLKNDIRSATIIGMGNQGMTLARQLAEHVAELHLIDAHWSNKIGQSDLRQRMKKYSEHRGYEVIGLIPLDNGIQVLLEQGQRIQTQQVFVCCGQRGNTAALNLYAAGIHADDRGQLWCNDHLETWGDQIYAVGSAVGYPEQPQSLNAQIELVTLAISGQRAGLIAVK